MARSEFSIDSFIFFAQLTFLFISSPEVRISGVVNSAVNFFGAR